MQGIVTGIQDTDVYEQEDVSILRLLHIAAMLELRGL
jgi:hypothetical protein